MSNTTHITVTVDISKVNFPLRPIYIGQGSALMVLLIGLPTGATAKLVLTPVDGSPAQAYVSAVNADGGTEVYVPGWAFADAGETDYEINAYADEINAYTGEAYVLVRWMGRGSLTALSANTVAEVPNAPAMPDGEYWWDSVTKLYYKLSLVRDPDTNRLTIDVSQEGVSSVP